MSTGETGGWCTPTYEEVTGIQLLPNLPTVSIKRGGIRYTNPRVELVLSQPWWYPTKSLWEIRWFCDDRSGTFGRVWGRKRAEKRRKQIYADINHLYNLFIDAHKARENAFREGQK